MLLLAKRVFKEYKPLVVRMNVDLLAIPKTKKTLEFICDVEIIMGLTYILSM
jgi:hypothetical protein